MRYRCQFLNTATDERLSVVADLTAAEIKFVEGRRAENGDDDANLYAMVFALKYAYARVPKNYQHIEPPTALRPS